MYQSVSQLQTFLGIRLAVGQRTLDPLAQVRILDPQLLILWDAAHSSSGQGHRPLKAKIRGSNPLCATTDLCWIVVEAEATIEN
jgi:hypothetical protein